MSEPISRSPRPREVADVVTQNLGQEPNRPRSEKGRRGSQVPGTRLGTSRMLE